MADIHLKCFGCASELEFVDRVGFRAECENCGEDVHVCKNCQFYDPSSYNECKETSADVVKDKERANYCDFFQAGSGLGGEKQKRDDLLSAAENLFKKK